MPTTPDLTATAPELEHVVDAYVAERQIPGAAVGIVVGDALAWSYGAGFADQATGRRVDERTLFRIASISKTFTATAVLQLRDRGQLRLDDPAIRHIPELAHADSPFGPIEEVTVRRLLTHTSGLATEPLLPDGLREYPWALEGIESALAEPSRIRVVDAPGSTYRYSNLGYGLLGVLVERLAGKPFDDVIRERITAPLGMDATTPEPTGDLAARCAQGYDRPAWSDRATPAFPYVSRWALGNGQLWSCVEDLARWAAAQLAPYGDPDDASGEPGILAQATLREMHRQTVLVDRGWASSQGLGWAGTREGDLVTVGHTGALPGFVTGFGLCLAERVGVITLYNTWPGRGGRSLARELLDIVRPVVAGSRAILAPAPPEAPDPAVAELLGSYLDAPTGDRVYICWHRGTLRLALDLTSPIASAPRLEATDEPLTFLAHDEDGREEGRVVFVREADGRIGYLTFDAMPHVRETPTLT